MIKFGTIVLVPFPFADLPSAKIRPALVVSKKESAQGDVILCFITSKPKDRSPFTITLPATADTGLKSPSSVRLDRIATLHRDVLLGEIGSVSAAVLRKHKKSFESVFGF